jgi:hypothetical protein
MGQSVNIAPDERRKAAFPSGEFHCWSEFLRAAGDKEGWNPKGWYETLLKTRFAAHGGCITHSGKARPALTAMVRLLPESFRSARRWASQVRISSSLIRSGGRP